MEHIEYSYPLAITTGDGDQIRFYRFKQALKIHSPNWELLSLLLKKKVKFTAVQQFTSGFQSLKWTWDGNHPHSSKNAKFGSYFTLFVFFWKHWKPELFWFWKLLFWFQCWKSRNLGYWQMLNFDFKSLKVKKNPTPWPFLGLKRPFYGDFNDIFLVQIHLKMAEKAKCQFRWPLLWPWFLHLFRSSAIYEQLFTTAEKV